MHRHPMHKNGHCMRSPHAASRAHVEAEPMMNHHAARAGATKANAGGVTGFYHHAIGVDISSEAPIASYVADLAATQPSTGWLSGTSWQVRGAAGRPAQEARVRVTDPAVDVAAQGVRTVPGAAQAKRRRGAAGQGAVRGLPEPHQGVEPPVRAGAGPGRRSGPGRCQR